jgi:hypothetical protein
VVHHEDDARFRVDAGEARLVGHVHAHPEEDAGGFPRQPVADPEIGVRIDRGDDLPGIPLDLGHHDVPRDVVRAGARAGGFQDLGVVHQTVDEDLPLRQ